MSFGTFGKKGSVKLDFVHFLAASSERAFLQLNKFLGRGEKTPSFEIYYAGVWLSLEAATKKCTMPSKKHVILYRKRYLICTEGKTEAIYFGYYRSSTGPIVVALDKSDHKVSLVKKTIEEKNIRIQTGEFDEEIDEVWVVLDRDANPLNRLDKSHSIHNSSHSG